MIDGRSGQYAVKFRKRLSEPDSAFGDTKFADRALVFTGAFFQNGNCLPHFASGFKISEKHDRISQITHINRRFHIADQPVLPDDQNADDAFAI